MYLALKMSLVIMGSGIAAQALKIISYYIENRKINFSRFFETGGMPSSHASTAMALTTMVGLEAGFNSVLFVMTLFFSCVIMYDAAGVRRAAGKQAAVLNKIMEEFIESKHLNEHKLAELLGHTPLEVFMGALLGILIGIIFS